MKKIYVGHCKLSDYEKELYAVVKSLDEYTTYEFILPHDMDREAYNGREFYKSVDLFIAEVSYKATGLGIELGWAFDDGVPIYYICKDGVQLGQSLRCLSDKFYTYRDEESLKEVLHKIIDDWRNRNDVKKI